MKIIAILIVGAIVTSCATDLKLNSNVREAQVYMYDTKLSQEKKLGTTPIVIKASALEEASAGNDFAFIRVSKFGYLPSIILVPVSWGVKGEVSVKLMAVNREYMSEQTRDDYQDTVSKIAFDFLKVQSLLESKKIGGAQKAMAKIKQEYGEIAPYYILQGNIHVAQKEYEKALLAYRRASRLYPKSKDIKKAINFLVNFMKDRKKNRR